MSRKILRLLSRFLLSRKTAVYLLILLSALLLAASALPDTSIMNSQELTSFQLSRPLLFRISSVFTISSLVASPLFLTLAGLLFASILACTTRRVLRKEAVAGGFSCERTCPSEIDTAVITDRLRSRRWRVINAGDTLLASKGSAGFWGSILFHVGMLVLLTAVLVSWLTQFSAELLLTEGFPITLGKDAFVRIIRSAGIDELPAVPLELKRFTPSYEQRRFARDFAADVLIDGSLHDIRVNRPAALNGFQLSLHRFGFAPSFRITDTSGAELLQATVNLVVPRGQRDSFDVPGTGYTIRTEFFPDFYTTGAGRMGSRGALPNNPAFHLTVLHHGKEVGSGLAYPGAPLGIGGIVVEFESLHYWADFILSRDRGLWLFAVGSCAVIGGLAARFIFPDKRLTIAPGETGMRVRGWCRYFPFFFRDEVDALINAMQKGTGRQ